MLIGYYGTIEIAKPELGQDAAGGH